MKKNDIIKIFFSGSLIFTLIVIGVILASYINYIINPNPQFTFIKAFPQLQTKTLLELFFGLPKWVSSALNINYVLSFFMFLLIIQVINFLYGFKIFKSFPSKKIKIYQLLLYVFITVPLLYFLINLGIIIRKNLIQLNYNYSKQLEKSVYITKVNKQLVVYGDNIELIGFRFGLKTDRRYRLNTDYGEIPTLNWQDNKVTFKVPNLLKFEKVNLWLEKPLNKVDINDTTILKSNVIQIIVKNR